MKKISVLIFLFVITMFGCSPVAPSLSPTLAPENIFTPIPTSTIEPIPTVVPTSTPLPHVSKITTLATFNAITAITSSNNVTDVWAVGNDGLIVAYQPSHDHPSFSHVESPKRVD